MNTFRTISVNSSLQHSTLSLAIHRMNYPPTKRLRGVNQDITTGSTFDDPFGDDDAFSQDDLAEIDILASQAFTSKSRSAPVTKPVAKAVETPGVLLRTSGAFNRDSKFEFNSGNNRRAPSIDPLGKFITKKLSFLEYQVLVKPLKSDILPLK